MIKICVDSKGYVVEVKGSASISAFLKGKGDIDAVNILKQNGFEWRGIVDTPTAFNFCKEIWMEFAGQPKQSPEKIKR